MYEQPKAIKKIAGTERLRAQQFKITANANLASQCVMMVFLDLGILYARVTGAVRER